MSHRGKKSKGKGKRRSRSTTIVRVLRRLADPDVQQRRREFEESHKVVGETATEREVVANSNRRVVLREPIMEMAVEEAPSQPVAVSSSTRTSGWIRKAAKTFVESSKRIVREVKRKVVHREKEERTMSPIHSAINPELEPVEFELVVSVDADADAL